MNTPRPDSPPRTDTPLALGNRALRAGNFAEAIIEYVRALRSVTPALGKTIAANLALARQKYLAHRGAIERPRVAVCSWELSHDAASRAYTLASFYESFADVEIIGPVFQKYGLVIWEPMRESRIPIHNFFVESEGHFLEQALQLVAAHPYDTIHLSTLRAPNILIGALYKLIWGSQVILDVDEDERTSAGLEGPINLDDYLKQHGRLPPLDNLDGPEWTGLAVGLVQEFDGVTVSNETLQRRYGGDIIGPARNEAQLEFSANRHKQHRKVLGIADDKKVVLFLDTPRPDTGLQEVADAIQSLQRQNIILAIVDDTLCAEFKRQLQSKEGVNYLFLENQPGESFADAMNIADCCVLIQDSEHPDRRYQIRAKLTRAFAMRIPVLAPKTSALTDVIEAGAIIAVTRVSLAQDIAKTLDNSYATAETVEAGYRYFLENLSFAATRRRLDLECALNTVQRSQIVLSPAIRQLLTGLEDSARSVIQCLLNQPIQFGAKSTVRLSRLTTSTRSRYECLVLEVLEPSFDKQFYLATYPFVTDSGLDPIEHYCKLGWKMGLNPSPSFSTSYYLEIYRDIKDAGINPFLHYVQHGNLENRKSLPGYGDQMVLQEIEKLTPYFDSKFYVFRYPQVSNTACIPIEHYVLEGWRQGLDPSESFSTSYYLELNPDIAAAGINPFLHYVEHGKSEKREGMPYYEKRRKEFSPLVSIIVPNYNHARFLPKRIQSITEQTYLNFEIIILDDNSSDDSLDVIGRIVKQISSPVRVISNSSNSGTPFLQWKKGIEHANGELIWICESDDFCESNFLENLIPHFAELSVMMAVGKIEFCDEEGNWLEGMQAFREGAEAGIWDRIIARTANQWFCGPFGVRNIVTNVGGCVFRKQIVPEQIWDQARKYKIVGDWYLYSHLLGGGKLIYDPRSVAYFRQHKKNTSASNFNKLHYYEECFHALVTICEKWDLPQEIRRRFWDDIKYQYYHFKMEIDHGSFDSRFPFEQYSRIVRRDKHILISILGFSPGGGELLPLNLANELTNQGELVSILAVNLEEINSDMLARLDKRISVYGSLDVGRHGAQAFVNSAGIDIIHTHMINCDNLLLSNVDPVRSTPYVVTLHGSYDSPGLDSAKILPTFMKGVTTWVYTADKNLEVFKDCRIDTSEFFKVANGMPRDDRPFQEDRKTMGISEDAIIFTLVARGIKQKGWRAAVEAFSMLQEEFPASDIYLLMVGDGNQSQLIKERICANEKRVRFLGYQSRINGIYRISDCAIVPSRFDGESAPLCIIQAMQEGLPVIATDIGEIRNMICSPSGNSGILIPNQRNSSQFFVSLKNAMKAMLDLEVRIELGRNATTLAKRFTLEKMTSKYLEIYEYSCSKKLNSNDKE